VNRNVEGALPRRKPEVSPTPQRLAVHNEDHDTRGLGERALRQRFENGAERRRGVETPHGAEEP